MCEHGRKRAYCKEGCGGQALCIHLKDKYRSCGRERRRSAQAQVGGGGRGVRGSELPQNPASLHCAHPKRPKRTLLKS